MKFWFNIKLCLAQKLTFFDISFRVFDGSVTLYFVKRKRIGIVVLLGFCGFSFVE